MAATTETSPKMLLKTADQYLVWKSRVSDACWAATHRDPFAVEDTDCKRGLDAYIAAQETRVKAAKGDAPEGPQDWVGKCWLIITSSLHDDLYRKVSHVNRGSIQSLLAEINHALVLNQADSVQPLRLEIYGATMQKDCGSDLQTWISYLQERANKLKFLKKPVEDEELAAIFLRGLPPVFNQLKVVFAIPGQEQKSFDGAVTIVRKFASDPTVAAELAKLKSNGLSQSMFPAFAQPAQPAGAKRYSHPCRQFSTTGSCSYGSRCRFAHTATPATPANSANSANPANSATPRQCTFCGFNGHTYEVCRKRLSRERNANTSAPANNSVSLLSSSESAFNVFHLDPTMVSGTPNSAVSTTTTENKHNVHVFTLSDSTPNLSKWVLDSGATCCATYAEADCVDVRDCQAHVTAWLDFLGQQDGHCCYQHPRRERPACSTSYD